MDKSNKDQKNVATDNVPASENNAAASKQKNRGRKRKRQDSDSSTDIEDILPDNTLEVEKNLQASALKNNLDDVSVKKILKKVVTNDHVLALVKLREEEEEKTASAQDPTLQPKLTRAKAKELMLMSPKSAPWTLELTPIKQLPVKTRPEVTALISNELPDDEDDDEYHPAHDDVPSDDEQTLESCSDVESAPATPSTHSDSPKLLTDGPFKVPQGLQTPVRRKLVIEEEATIALRTRSKINLSATSIEHIESSFVPPDEVPTPVGDDLWNKFLEECLNPGEVSKNEDDEEADPEYNVAADPDAHDEDDDALRGPLIKISKKELNDLVTELFGIIPEGSVDEVLGENLTKDLLNNSSTPATHWEGKQEPISDEEINQTQQQTQTNRNAEKRDSAIRFSIGKSEPDANEYFEIRDANVSRDVEIEFRDEMVPRGENVISGSSLKGISVVVEEHAVAPAPPAPPAPPPLRALLAAPPPEPLRIDIDDSTKILPAQIQLLQQQLRQHVQLCAGHFLQLFVHPYHWELAPTYKDYLEQFIKMTESCPNSVADVCNLRPALELMRTWETTVSPDTPENKELVEFIKKEADRSYRRFKQNAMYAGEFHEMVMQVVANSPVFLYPYLLPAMPFRGDNTKKFGYRRSEDELIALGLDQFWQYVEANPDIYKQPGRFPRGYSRWGLYPAVELLCKYMLPWKTPRLILGHINRARKEKDNPIYRLFAKQEISPVTHQLLPFNPALTLYEQPAHEMPRIWARYLSKNSGRFRDHIYKRVGSGKAPDGVPLTLTSQQPYKVPLPIEFVQKRVINRVHYSEPGQDKLDLQVTNQNGVNNSINIIPINNGGVVNVPGPQVLQGVSLITLNNTAVANNNPIEAITAECTQVTSKTNESHEKVKTGPVLTISAGVIMNSQTNHVTNTQNKENTDIVTASNTVTGNLIPVTNVTPLGNAISSDNEVPGNHMSSRLSDIAKNNNGNMFQIVPTSAGVILIPINAQNNTNTVSSVNTPISTTITTSSSTQEKEKSPGDKMLDHIMTMVEELKNHCQCCIMLRRITKKQAKITDFFKPKEHKSQCDCTGKKYPRISKRLKLLVHNYRSKFWCEQSEVRNMLNTVADIRNGEKLTQKENENDGYSIEDIEFVTSYQMKMITRGLLIKNIYTKKRIYNVFSQFNTLFDNPIDLATKLNVIFNVDLCDLYDEFMGFLTPEQADKMNRFRDYFLQICLKDLLKRIEEDVKDPERKTSILNHINGIFSDNISTSCEICAGILATLPGYPKLAEYVFSFFPHRYNGVKKDRCTPKNKMPAQHKNTPPPQNKKTSPPQNKKTSPPQNKKTAPPLRQLAKKPTPQIRKLQVKTLQKQSNEIMRKELGTSLQTDTIAQNKTNEIVQKELETSLHTDTIAQNKTNEIEQKELGTSLHSDTIAQNKTNEIEQKELGTSLHSDTIAQNETKETVPKELANSSTIKNYSCAVNNKDQIEKPTNLENESNNINEQIKLPTNLDNDNDNIKKQIKFPTDIDKDKVQDSETMEVDQQEELVICDENVAGDYEADHSSCGEEDNEETKSNTGRRKSTSEGTIYESAPHTNYYETEITISKTEVQEHSDSTVMSPLVMSEDEPVKSEAPEWKREEDKLILELLLQYLTPRERKDKTILETLDEKNVYHMIAETLPHKSVDEVKDRVMYLLEILVMSEF